MKNFKKQLFILSILTISIISFGFVNYNSNPSKITICHVPPGNPGNCHEITISTNALQAHLDHGDRIICDSPATLMVARNLLGMQDTDINYLKNFVVINF